MSVLSCRGQQTPADTEEEALREQLSLFHINTVNMTNNLLSNHSLEAVLWAELINTSRGQVKHDTQPFTIKAFPVG